MFTNYRIVKSKGKGDCIAVYDTDAENIYNVGLPKPRSVEESDAMMWLGINNIRFQIEYKDGKAGTYIFLSGDII